MSSVRNSVEELHIPAVRLPDAVGLANFVRKQQRLSVLNLTSGTFISKSRAGLSDLLAAISESKLLRKLLMFGVAGSSETAKQFRDAVARNGYLVDVQCSMFKSADIVVRNNLMHGRCRLCCYALLAVRWFRKSVMSLNSKQMIQISGVAVQAQRRSRQV
jgi:hypothetical protein